MIATLLSQFEKGEEEQLLKSGKSCGTIIGNVSRTRLPFDMKIFQGEDNGHYD